MSTIALAAFAPSEVAEFAFNKRPKRARVSGGPHATVWREDPDGRHILTITSADGEARRWTVRDD